MPYIISIEGNIGSGKSTFIKHLHKYIEINQNSEGPTITCIQEPVDEWNMIRDSNGESILELAPDERAQQGIFLAFQYPIEIPGVSNGYFLREAFNSINKARGNPPLKPVQFGKLAKEKIKMLKMDESFLKRSLNEGFSGGEKKRNEILQMAILEPLLSILDETDSGLDIDALQIVANGVNSLRSKETAFLVITHYQRLLDYIVPDYVHVLVNGKIVKSGGKELALELESKGYSWLED